jgi:hypothetical protein
VASDRQTINNNINIINNITQITYHTNDAKGKKANQNSKQDSATVIDAETLESMVNLGMSRDDV